MFRYIHICIYIYIYRDIGLEGFWVLGFRVSS